MEVLLFQCHDRPLQHLWSQQAFAEAQRPRSGFASLRTTPVSETNSDLTLIVMVAVSIISVTALAGLIIKKRKETK